MEMLPLLCLALLVLIPAPGFAWERSRVASIGETNDKTHQLFAVSENILLKDDTFMEWEAATFYEPCKTNDTNNSDNDECYAAGYTVEKYDSNYNSYNITQTYYFDELNKGDKNVGSTIQLALTNDENPILIYGNGKTVCTRYFNPNADNNDTNDNVVTNEKCYSDKWGVSGDDNNAYFDLFMTDISNSNILISKGNKYCAMSLNDISNNPGCLNNPKTIDSNENIITAAISSEYYAIGTASSVYLGKIGETAEKMDAIITEKYYSLALNSYLYMVYLETSENETTVKADKYEINGDSVSRKDSMYITEDLGLNKQDESLMSCHPAELASKKSKDINIYNEISVNIGHSSYADDYTLLIFVPICQDAFIPNDESTSYTLTTSNIMSIYYPFDKSTDDNNNYVKNTETPSIGTYTVNYNRAGTATAPTTPYQVNMRLVGSLSNEVAVVNGLLWTVPNVANNDIKIEVTGDGTTGNSPTIFRSCSRLTHNYPECTPRSFTKHFKDGEILLGCPIQYDGYYCDKCAPRYKKTSKDDSDLECDSCSAAYFGPRCSASSVGVLLLFIVYLLLAAGSIIGYCVNRKE